MPQGTQTAASEEREKQRFYLGNAGLLECEQCESRSSLPGSWVGILPRSREGLAGAGTEASTLERLSQTCPRESLKAPNDQVGHCLLKKTYLMCLVFLRVPDGGGEPIHTSCPLTYIYTCTLACTQSGDLGSGSPEDSMVCVAMGEASSMLGWDFSMIWRLCGCPTLCK